MTKPYIPAPDVKARAIVTVQAEAIERLGVVATLRHQLDAVTAEVQAEEQALYDRLKPLTDRQAELKVQLGLAEQEAKTLALDLYAADPTNKKPVPGASIRVKRGVAYDAEVAFTWASAKGLFIKPPTLDAKALETFLLTEPKTDGLGYEITETPTVALDSALPLPETAR